MWPIIEFISVLPLIILKVKLPLLLGYTLVSDRCTIDTTVSVALATRNMSFTNGFLGDLLLKMMPKERIIIFLDADSSTVLRRKPDVHNSIEEINDMMRLYRVMARKTRVHLINPALTTIRQVRDEIAGLLFKESMPETTTIRGSALDFSIVVPTYNRALKLKTLLRSVLEQDALPKEVVIIDQNISRSTFDVASAVDREFLDKGIALKYLYLDKKSASRARNLGIDHSSGEVVFFIDDDIILLRGYIKNVLGVYESFPDALGVQGVMLNYKPTYDLESLLGRLENQLRRAFFLSYYRQNTWKVMPSINDVFPFPITALMPAERFQGCCSYKRGILDDFRFDENLEEWSLLEDLDLSYRIYKSKKGVLYVTPEARLIHEGETHMTSSLRSESYKKIVNRTYMFSKLMEQSPRNCAIFCWSILGFLLTTLLGAIIGGNRKSKWGSIYLIEAVFSALKHLGEIRQLDLRFFNSHKL
jgi:glycosyltransferase involved in cell wall biosynthesis